MNDGRGGNYVGGPRGGEWDGRQAINRGPLSGDIPEPRSYRPGEMQAFLRDAQQQLSQLQQGVRNDPALAREVQDLARAIQRIDPNGLDNAVVAERIQAQLLAEIESVEMQLRRKVEDEQGGAVRSPSSRTIAPGYADAVAEYFRRLSKAK
jgi:hypothetical protein